MAQTIEVRVDEALVSSGWDYDPEGNAIVFEEASVPEVGATVRVSYHEQPDCAG